MLCNDRVERDQAYLATNEPGTLDRSIQVGIDASDESRAVSAVRRKALARINDTGGVSSRFDSCSGPGHAVHLLERGHDIGHILSRQGLVIGHQAKESIHRFEVR